MKRHAHLSLMLAAIMVIGAAVAAILTPSVKLADLRQAVDLQTMIPRQFGVWVVDETLAPIAPNPEVRAKLNRFYNQTLERTYVDRSGNRVMLSIAYGGDQSDALQVHRPEVCYAGQGFEITRNVPEELSTKFGALPIRRLVAIQGFRHEPITYWVTVGDKAAHAGWKQKLAQLSYGLSGKVPDGMLVRVSSIDWTTSNAYRVHEEFINGLLTNLTEQSRVRVAGHFDG